MNKSAKKKGLSMEEKVSRIETWFVNNPSPYTLKDLIQILPKATGVIPQSVEECMEILVSENRVRQKKVGVHVLFWRFPQTATQRLAGSMGEKTTTTELAKYLSMSEDELRTELQTLKKTEKDIRQRIKETQASIGDDNAVQKDAEQIRSLQGEVKILEEQLNQLALLDPAFVEKLKTATVVAWESANRWTDNMYLLEQHISRKMGMSARELRAQLQLPLEVEYIEYDELLPSATSGGKSACTSSGNSCASPLICTVDATHGGGDSQEVPAAFHIEEGHTQNINEEAGEALTEGGCDVKPHEDVENETSNTLRKEKDGKKRGRGRPPLENAKKDDNMVNAPSVKKKKNEKDRPPAASNTDALTPARQRRCRR
ncbi:hypothetical protein, conserved [Trypanosoma brucei gambiense DAL972]|uniref:Mnd1 HTH domain-containing protein n=1 Tax=Trypanosoma brucei gambiense (strain MHOM/CI/86/DAL972) TaxID=679716 RepID=D0A770_TRYB9|nr:hypothetical protein, conserved [Trypanosoma brucei gambiense DAL972]CBH17521.1 hypothetical protein, conserved [Trypanosoma brucei gambiense DAL972]|eukprot:XP_011779785.1 hypothetical protein, conserved [Trypanosoma brucei gambiense DAL972]